MKQRDQTRRIRSFILDNVSEHPDRIARLTAEHFGITRQAVGRHLRALADEGLLEPRGRTRRRTYELKPIVRESFRLPITPELAEDLAWREHIAPLLSALPRNVLDICQYGLTEMVNNVVDHSRGRNAYLQVTVTPRRVELGVTDDGVGIFRKISTELGLPDERHAILELAKGKLTTDPERHTGEGIFFASKMFESFAITSGELLYVSEEEGNGWRLDEGQGAPEGTYVRMRISSVSTRSAASIFDRYAPDTGDYAFGRTRVPVDLVRCGEENLISRSQARRLLARLDRFDEVWLDFQGVERIGQAFADEIFRVFAGGHPNTRIVPVRANDEVRKIIERVGWGGPAGPSPTLHGRPSV